MPLELEKISETVLEKVPAALKSPQEQGEANLHEVRGQSESHLRAVGILPPASPTPPPPPVVQSDYEALYRAQEAENEQLRNVIAAGRLRPIADHPQKDAKPAMTAARLEGTLGRAHLLKMTRNEKLAAMGLNPVDVNDDFLHRVFGRGNNGRESQELYNSSPLRYRQLKEAAIILKIFGS